MPSGKRLLLLAVVVSLVATAAIAIAILLFGEFDDTQARILGTTGFIALAGLLALPAAVLLEQDRFRVLAAATAALAVGAFAASMAALWGEGDTAWNVTGSLAAAAVAATQVAGLATRLREGDPRVVRGLFAASTLLVAAAAGMVVGAIWGDPRSDTYPRVLAAIAVADVLLVVLQPVLRRGGRDPLPHRVRLTLADGTTTDVDAAGSDFADAVARAIRRAERAGQEVRAAERMPS